MAKKEDDGCVTLAEANRQYMRDNKETEKDLNSTKSAVHRAIDVTFGRLQSRGGAVRTQKALRGGTTDNPNAPKGELTS